MIQINSIKEVLEQLELITSKAIEEEDKIGFFAVLYKKVTERIKLGIDQQEFEDNERMERLDVLFASRYLKAYSEYKSIQVCSSLPWQVAFDNSAAYWPIILQHILLGINAHINVDLGIAAALTSPGNSIHSLRNDFDKVNSILADLITPVETAIGEVSPILGFLDKIGGKTDEKLVEFSIKISRDESWKVAERFASLNPDSEIYQEELGQLELSISKLATKIASPPLILTTGIKIIRLTERAKPSTVIQLIENIA